MIFWNTFIIILVILWGAIGIESTFKVQNKLSRKDINFMQKLYFFHLVVSLIFSYYVMGAGGDAKAYWFISSRFGTEVDWFHYFKTGTFFMLFLTYPLVKYFEISFYVGGLLFGAIGFSSFIYLYIIIRKFIKRPIVLNSLYVFPFILYLPNLHFWSAGIGKDAITTFGIMLFYYSLFNFKKKWFWSVFALAIVYQIRPHIDLFLLASSFLALIIDGKMKPNIKIGLAIIIVLSGLFMYENVLAFLKLDEVSSESITQFSDSKATSLGKNSGSSVDMSNYPIPLKILTFLYRPFFFDINGVLYLISSLENLILLWLSILVFRWSPFSAFKAAPMPIKSIFIFFVVTTLAFSLTLGNLGIMLRQKNASIFCLLIFIFWCFAYNQYKKNRKKQTSSEKI